jgi:hypothetical protein
MRGTTLCSVSGPRKMVRPASNLRTNVQLTWRWVGSTLGASVREDPSACLWQARHPVSAHWEEGPEHDRFRIDRGVTRYAIRGDRHALESDGRSSTPQSTKGRAFHHEIRPHRRNRCALLITSRINAPIQGEAGLVSERSGFIGMMLCPE